MAENTPITADNLPDYPFFEVDDVTAAFGCDIGKYVPRYEGAHIARVLRKQADAFKALFFRGGKLTDHGFKLKDEYSPQGHATIRALMCSFAPSHEAKTGTVALAIYHWCDEVSEA